MGSLERTLEQINVTATLINNLIESQRAALEQQLNVSREADYNMRRACFPLEALPEYWEEVEQQLEQAKKQNNHEKAAELKELLKRKPRELVPSSIDIIVGCGGGDRFFRKALLSYLWRLIKKYLTEDDYRPSRYAEIRKAYRAYGAYLWNLSADWVLKNNDFHEMNLSAAIALQQIRIVAARTGEKLEEERR